MLSGSLHTILHIKLSALWKSHPTDFKSLEKKKEFKDKSVIAAFHRLHRCFHLRKKKISEALNKKKEICSRIRFFFGRTKKRQQIVFPRSTGHPSIHRPISMAFTLGIVISRKTASLPSKRRATSRISSSSSTPAECGPRRKRVGKKRIRHNNTDPFQLIKRSLNF